MKLDETRSYKKAEDAIHCLYTNGVVFLYNINENVLEEEISKLYGMIKERNDCIEDINNQMIATNAYRFRGNYKCLGVYCCEISVGLYKDNRGVIAMTGWNTSVLHGDIDITPSKKALMSMMMLGWGVCGT